MTDSTQGASGTNDTGAGGGEGLPSASDILAFDPFGPADEATGQVGSAATPTPPPADDKGGQSGKTPPAANQPEPVVPDLAKPPAVDPNATPAPPATPPAPAQPTIQELTSSIVAALETKKPTEETPPAEAPPKYNLALPPQVLGLLRSEDPGEFAQGMHTVINGIANKLHMDMQGQLQQVVAGLLQRMPEVVAQHHEQVTTKEQVASDFFGTYAHLDLPAVKPLIQQIGMQVAQARAAAGKSVAWSAELRDEIAEAVHAAVPQLRPAAAAPAAPTRPKAPYAAGGGARPAPTEPNEFAEVLGL